MRSSKEYIDTTGWKEFSLSNLFGEPQRGKRLKVADRLDGDICLLTAGKENQGYAQSIGNNDMPKFHDALTIDMFGNCFWHGGDFTGDDNILVMNHDKLNERTGLFIASVINAKHRQDKYDYEKQYRQKTYAKDKILLPVDANGDPDWSYMENFMDEIMDHERSRIEQLKDVRNKPEYIDVQEWEEFRLDRICDVEHVQKMKIPGKSYIKDYEIVSDDGTVPYIAATSRNNGITGYSSYEANNLGDCITLSTTADSAKTVFYQEKDFIGRQQIAGIRLKDNRYMGKQVGLFLVSCIKRLLSKYDWGTKLTIDNLRKIKLLLPVDANGEPDWAYMDGFMSEIIERERERLCRSK